MRQSYRSFQRQSGAALAVALILLVVISLMAVSSMNTATLDLMMAGNEQFRSRAFTAAESGIEEAWRNGTYDSAANAPATTKATGVGSDQFTHVITRPNGGIVEAAPSGNSEGTFGAVYFRISSTGSSDRNSSAETTQELFQVVPAPEEFGHSDDACAGTTSLDAAMSAC